MEGETLANSFLLSFSMFSESFPYTTTVASHLASLALGKVIWYAISHSNLCVCRESVLQDLSHHFALPLHIACFSNLLSIQFR